MSTFSTIIPCFNRQNYIASTIDSVLAQAESNEIIVVDDGSTDDSMKIVQAYGDRVTILQQKNRGPGAARNLGAAASKGAYLCFLDSDDVWFPWTLTTFQNLIAMHDRPAVVAGEPIPFHKATELQEVQEETLDAVKHPDFLAAQPAWFQPSGMAIRRDMFEQVGGFTQAHCEDADLWLRLGVSPGLVAVSKPACFGYRLHAAGISNVPSVKADMERLIDEEISGHYPGGPDRQWARREYISMHMRGTSLYYLRAGVPRRAMHLYRRMFLWNMRLGRWKYILSLPALAAVGILRDSKGPKSAV
jgi:glycosyltransferase involved in cell wall biosynthesis